MLIRELTIKQKQVDRLDGMTIMWLRAKSPIRSMWWFWSTIRNIFEPQENLKFYFEFVKKKDNTQL